MRVVIFTNRQKDPGGAVTGAVVEVLTGSGVECDVFGGDEAVFKGAYAALSLGGDGTFLRCAKYAAPRGVAVLGIHLGHTGYLSRIKPDGLDELRSLASFKVRERSMLESSDYVAVNDFTFSRGMAVQTVSLELEVDGHALGSFLGDGVVISSATGSTGYALSAGGPVVDPNLSALLVTPICAHTSRPRAFVLAPDRVLTVAPSNAERRHIYISADGGEPRRMLSGERVEIRVSKQPLLCLEPERHNFFDNVRIHRL
jgi:NAD+ kinase